MVRRSHRASIAPYVLGGTWDDARITMGVRTYVHAMRVAANGPVMIRKGIDMTTKTTTPTLTTVQREKLDAFLLSLVGDAPSTKSKAKVKPVAHAAPKYVGKPTYKCATCVAHKPFSQNGWDYHTGRTGHKAS